MRKVTDVDRLAVRHRPHGQPVMHQSWGKLLFMHWRVNENLIRPHIPSSLQIDTYGDWAWIGIVPFTMWDIRGLPPYMPPILGLDSMHELNVRNRAPVAEGLRETQRIQAQVGADHRATPVHP